MRTNKLRSVKSVLKFVRSRIKNSSDKKSEIDDKFICSTIEDVWRDHDLVTAELMEETLEYFESQKPTEELHTEFFNHSTFDGDYAWWTRTSYVADRWSRGPRKQRVLFLTMLINNL
jgi:hypothetical protein